MKNKNIKGITINEQEIKISQYADDTTLILDGSPISFTTSLKILDLFSEISGLRLNNKKNRSFMDWRQYWKQFKPKPGKRLQMGKRQS